MNRKAFFASLNKGPEQRLEIKRRLLDLLGGKCVDCGYDAHMAALEFDHINPKLKKFELGKSMATRDYVELLEEAKKCEIRCSNCHRIKTWTYRTLKYKHRKLHEQTSQS